MILPFIGVFLSLTIWSTLLPVPGLTTPQDPLIKRISAAIEVTTMAKGIHDLAELATASAHTYRAPSPRPSVVHHSPTTPTTTASPPDTSPTALAAPQTKALAVPQTKALTIYIPLREPPHPDTSKVCIPPPGFFVPYRYRSMTPCAVCSLLTLAKVGAIVWFVVEIVLLMLRMAWAVGRDMYDAFAQLTSPHPDVVDSPSALYDEIDALVEGLAPEAPAADVCCFPFQGAFAAKLGTAAAAAATEEQEHRSTEQQKTCTTHCELETATAHSRPGQQWAPVSPAAGMGTASEGSADEVRSVMDADLDVASAWAPPYAPARHWALVVRRLENVSPFYFLEFCTSAATITTTTATIATASAGRRSNSTTSTRKSSSRSNSSNVRKTPKVSWQTPAQRSANESASDPARRSDAAMREGGKGKNKREMRSGELARTHSGNMAY
ncbi:predicted protein [Aspergillus terreus NIH2624]|uniref:Uncharacterized protein n=1 Tax=Aspergillus terreus (strain NIH 2624 / FGSC A1156) TaxID=341663 RepID=Q0CHD6_ASPTN|nr:uncharacterized protein ATEG_06906 [Aspergillus terreus NIH2624]EAU32290.1 predicted protein [Aspergillus terreus NIH2624]